MRNKRVIASICLLSSFWVQSQTTPSNTVLDSIINSPVVEEYFTDTLPYKTDMNTSIQPKKFTPKFKNNYKSDPDFNYEEASEEGLGTLLKNLWNDLKRWLLKHLIPTSQDLDSFSLFIKIGFWLLIGFILYLLMRLFINKDIDWFFTKKKKTFPTTYDILENDITSIPFESLIAKTILNEEYRLAIRYYYLWLLQTLSKQEHIVWELEKTNADYLLEIKDSELKAQFRYLSYLYNNVWYGEFSLEKDTFNHARSSFEKTLNELNI